MRKQVILAILFSLLLLPTILATDSTKTIDSQIQKLNHYAEEYETGNIDYVQLIIYISSVREGMNEILGVTNREIGGVVKQEQIEKILGEPFEETKWIWVEGEERDIKLDFPVPIWRKIIFDGKKIQIRMEAFPSIFGKRKFDDNFEGKEFQEEIEEGSIIYRLHFNTEFKRPQDQLDIDSKVDEIKLLAEEFSENPTNANAENLAKQGVNAERVFQNYFMQGQGKCEDIMKAIFGSENQRQTQKILSNEFTFYEGEDFEAMMRLEMCEECEWNYINLHMWIEGRFRHQEEEFRREYKDYKQMTEIELMSEIKQVLENTKQYLESGEYEKAQIYSESLNSINQAWSEKSNNVWDEVRVTFENQIDSMSEEERYEFDQNYGWIKQDQQQRQVVKEIQKEKYEQRKAFYFNLFSEYDMKELYFTQTDFEKRLVEEFKEKGEEICNNNQDDNENGEVDCADSQCGGKICGTGMQTTTSGNETAEVQVDFYCIQSICQAREEINESTESICGNHICEEGEADTSLGNGTCQSDCTFAECPKHDAIECSGKVIFEGEDENGCTLPPICIEETGICSTTEDCVQPTCGVAECVRAELEDEEGICKIIELIGCTSECESWEQEIEECNNQKIVTKICENGQWQETGAECESSGCKKCGNECVSEEDISTMLCEESTEDFNCFKQDGGCTKEFLPEQPSPISTEPIVGYECIVAIDCGGENDVCSNGKCTSIPEVIRVDEEEPELEVEQEQEVEEPEEQQESEEEPEEEPEVEVEVEESEESQNEAGVFGLFKALLGRFTIIGRVVAEESESEETSSDDETSNEESIQETDESSKEESTPKEEPTNEEESNEGDKEDYNDGEDSENYDDDYDKDHENDRDRWEDEDKKERERHEEENRERCANDCVRPCIDRCTRDACGDEMECDIEVELKTCEKSCQPDDNCIEKCTSGNPDWWKEFEDEDIHKQEKGVFQVGGGCRKEQGRTEGHIWFGGWGDPFERVQGLKEQYYFGGEADWCKHDLENLIKQRQEFERGFNQEFAVWFFEKYLPSSAEEWEQAQSGIYELYWNNVETQRQLAERMNCLGKNDVQDVMDINLINIEYETEFGSLEYWEEIQTVKMDWMEEKVTIISPYMKVWIFPSEEFVKYEMKRSMAKGEFPGHPEEKAERENEEGLTDEEKTKIRENEKVMKIIQRIIDEYNGNANINFQVADEGEVVFNMHIQINEEDIMLIKPMLPEETPSPDVTIQLGFMELYDMINFEEKEMRGAELESPPWDYKPRQGVVKGLTDNIKMYFKVRALINSAEVTPSSAKGDAKDLMMSFVKLMGDKEDKGKEDMKMEDENSQEQSGITGEVIRPTFKF